MFFSVLIPVYKTTEYLDDCLNSIIAQSFSDFEIVLLDDGSPDDSSIVCDYYAAKYPFIRVEHKHNEGLLMTRRRGFQTAQGDFFICVDSDDYLISEKAFEKIHSEIIDKQCDLLLFNYIYGGSQIKPDKETSIIDDKVIVTTSKQEYYDCILNSKGSSAIWAKVPSREIVDIDNDYSEINKTLYKSMCEDYIQSFPINTAATIISHICEPLYYYRYNGDSISKNVEIKFYYAYRTAYEVMDKYLKQWNLSDDIIHKQKVLSQNGMIDHLINSVPKNRNEIASWIQFVRNIRQDKPLVNAANENVGGKINTYYHFVAKAIVNDHPYLALFLIKCANAIHNLLEVIRGRTNAAKD